MPPLQQEVGQQLSLNNLGFISLISTGLNSSEPRPAQLALPLSFAGLGGAKAYLKMQFFLAKNLEV